jgi:hypothetical protein
LNAPVSDLGALLFITMDRVPVTSTAMLSTGYDPDSRVLEIELINGDIYQYLDVPKHVYEDLLSAESKGRYLNMVIKPMGFRYQKL